mgnify:CR=1 FL=1
MLIHSLHSEFCQYQKTFKNNTPRTIKWFEEIFNYFVTHMEIIHLEQVNRQILMRWFIKGKSEKNWSAKTIRNRMTALSIFFKYCVNEGYLEENPLDKIDKPKVEKYIPSHLKINEAAYILDWLKISTFKSLFQKKRAIAIIAMFLYTGLRLSELMNLKHIDVDFENKTILIKAGKGRKDRSLPMIRRLEVYLKDYLRYRKDEVYFFTSIQKKGIMSSQVIKRLFTKIKKGTEIHIHAHKLRHSFAVQMLEGGCDIYTLSKLLGHSDINTTTIYLTATQTQKKKEAEKHPLY